MCHDFPNDSRSDSVTPFTNRSRDRAVWVLFRGAQCFKMSKGWLGAKQSLRSVAPSAMQSGDALRLISATPPSSQFQQMSRSGVVLLGLVLTAVSGCRGYIVGSAYSTDIRTVSVSIFKSDSFRRGVEFQLTEAVQKQIQSRTPFRIAKGPDADTILTGRIIRIRKRVLGETGQDDPRQLQLQLAVEVTWEDRRSGRILSEQRIPIAPGSIQLVSQAAFAPEIGQSLATAQKQAVDSMARQIVDMMETPW